MLLEFEFALIIDVDALNSSSTKSSSTVLSPSLAVLVRKDDDDDDAVGLLAHVLRVVLWLLLMPTVLGADDRDANAST